MIIKPFMQEEPKEGEEIKDEEEKEESSGEETQ